MSDTSRLAKTARKVDDRFRSAGFLKGALKKIFPDHWSFLLGEVALYSFIILVLTGVFLTLFFKPSMSDVIYHGSYTKLAGAHMSEAYASALDISFDVRGGLLMRQVHHWAALIFVAAIAVHMMRIFFTGAFRKPRELNWVIGVTMFALAVAEGFFGYSLPDDLLSGTGVRIAEGVMLSVPIVGTYIVFFVFGGQFPGHAFIPRFYIVHVLLIPGLLIALITAHLMTIWHQGHTQWPGRRKRDNNEVGDRLWPVFLLKTQSLFFFVVGTAALLAAAAQINPIWLYGPYEPAAVSSGSQPDWYIGFMEGSLRIMPHLQTNNLAGHTIEWGVFLPAVVLPIGFFIVSGLYPFLEGFATGDRRYHQVLDRPRNEPTRTAIGAAVVAMGGDLLVAGGDDLLAVHFHIPLEYLVWSLRIGFFVFPVIAFLLARYTCLALQRLDQRRLEMGIGTGIITQKREGVYAAVKEPVPDEARAVLETRRPDDIIIPIPWHFIPLPTPRRICAQVRARLNHFYTNYRVETPSANDGKGRDDESRSAAKRKGGKSGWLRRHVRSGALFRHR
ncbi:MAG: cytochrome b [Micromonosporaceae bacterium]